jgi:hypothetical protein
MGTVEIHIKNNKVHRIEGYNVMVYVYDDEVEHTIQMEFKKQGADYEDYKNNGSNNYEIDFNEEEQ